MNRLIRRPLPGVERVRLPGPRSPASKHPTSSRQAQPASEPASPPSSQSVRQPPSQPASQPAPKLRQPASQPASIEQKLLASQPTRMEQKISIRATGCSIAWSQVLDTLMTPGPRKKIKIFEKTAQSASQLGWSKKNL